jgi:hypothetical protein
MSKIIDIKGLRGVRVFQLYQQILIAYACCPMSKAKSFDEFFSDFEDKWTDEQKEKALRVGISLFDFDPNDINIIASFAINDNGVEVSNDVSTMTPPELSNIILEVFKKVGAYKIFLSSKKK